MEVKTQEIYRMEKKQQLTWLADKSHLKHQFPIVHQS